MVGRSIVHDARVLTLGQTESTEEPMAGPATQQPEEPLQVSVDDSM